MIKMRFEEETTHFKTRNDIGIIIRMKMDETLLVTSSDGILTKKSISVISPKMYVTTDEDTCVYVYHIK